MIERYYRGPLSEIPTFDSRLVAIRKRFNNGIDPYQKLQDSDELKIIQRKINKHMTIVDVAKDSKYSKHQISTFISLGLITKENGPIVYGNHKSKRIYKMYRFDQYIGQGTLYELSQKVNLKFVTVQNYASPAYNARPNDHAYRLERVK